MRISYVKNEIKVLMFYYLVYTTFMNRPSNRTLMVFPWLKDVPELNPNSFMFEEHEMDNSWLCHGDLDTINLPEGWICLGWADGLAIPVRPKPGMLAVRFANEDGQEFWLHLCI